MRLKVRQRGEVMAAFQEGYPGLTVFLTFGHSLVWKRTGGGKTPAAECRDGLLGPFLDGMIETSTRPGQIVDGHELSYGYRDAADFVRAHDTIKSKAATLAADRKRDESAVSAGFGLWLDHDWRKLGWRTDDLAANYFSPDRFETSVRAAIEQADEYVWIYTEKPRGGRLAAGRSICQRRMWRLWSGCGGRF